MKEWKEYKYKLRTKKKLFFDEEKLWGVYSFEFVDWEDEIKSSVKVHPTFKNFVISGNATDLKEGEERLVIFKDSISDRYGEGYEFIEIVSDGLKKPEAQAEFIRQMVDNENRYRQIREIFPPNETYIEDFISGKNDLTLVKGIGEDTQERLINKFQQHEGYQEVIVMLSPIGVGISTVTRLAEDFHGVDNLLKVLDTDVYRITSSPGFGFKKVDDLALKLGYELDSPMRLTAGAEYVLRQMSESGDIKIPIEEFDAEMCNILGIPEINDEIFGTILSDKRFTYIDGHICLEKLRLEELRLAQRLIQLNERAKELEGLEEHKEEIIKSNEAQNGFEFNQQQLDFINGALNQGVTILTGYGGTGKTASLKTVVDIYKNAGYEPVAIALSGKASQVMAESGITNSGTIHRKLNLNNPDTRNDKENPLQNELVILDEASMVNNSLFLKIVEAIEDGHRFIIVGDDAQLPPIGHGAVFHTLLNSDLPISRLTEIHRQAANSGIITAATDVRNGKQLNRYGSSENQVIGNMKDMRIFNYVDKTRIPDDLKAVVQQYVKNPNMNPQDLQVLTAMKRGSLGVQKLNEELQEILNPHPEGKKKDFHLVNDVEIRVGDRVIQNGNLYKAVGYKSMGHYELGEHFTTDVFNGTIGYVVDYTKHGLLVKFDLYTGTEYVYYAKEAEAGKKPIGMLSLAYAITTHRSQGSGFKTVFFVFDYSAYMLLSKEFVYTGITRAIDQCLMFVENTALHQAIKTTQGVTRKTFLDEFLEAEFKKLEETSPF